MGTYTATGAGTALDTPSPSSTWTLQLYFDLTTQSANQDGLFADNSSSHNSKVWTNSAGGNPTPDHVLTINKTDNAGIGLTINFNLPAGTSFSDSSALIGPGGAQGGALRITVVFGRNKKHAGSTAIYASPFGSPNPVTVFDWVWPAATITNNSATLNFGVPSLFSNATPPPPKKDCYAFIVAITLVTSNGQTQTRYTASHDPEMEVNM